MMWYTRALLLLGILSFVHADISVPPGDGDRNNGYYSIPVPETFEMTRLAIAPSRNCFTPPLSPIAASQTGRGSTSPRRCQECPLSGYWQVRAQPFSS